MKTLITASAGRRTVRRLRSAPRPDSKPDHGLLSQPDPKAAADYKAAVAACKSTQRQCPARVCIEEAKVARARAESMRWTSTTTPPSYAAIPAPQAGRCRIRAGQGALRCHERRRQGQLRGRRPVGAHRRAGDAKADRALATTAPRGQPPPRPRPPPPQATASRTLQCSGRTPRGGET